MVSGADKLEFQTKLHYLVNHDLKYVTKPFEFSVLIGKMCIIIDMYQKHLKTTKKYSGGIRTYMK